MAPQILITGASRGIGLALATEFAARGWRVRAACRSPESADLLKTLAAQNSAVSIHRADCAAVQRLLARDPDRRLPVDWGRGGAASYAVDLVLHAFDRKWLLKDVTNVIAQAGVNILALDSRADDAKGLAELRLAVRVADFGQLSDLLGRLGSLPGVREARRVSEAAG